MTTTRDAGWVNAHTHLYSALTPLGMPAPEVAPANFVQILERVWWRLDRAVDADALRAGTRLYAAEALLAGTTTVVDHHESPSFIEGSLDVIAEACEEIGIRALLCYGATERNGGLAEARRGLEENARFIRDNDRDLVRGVVGLHASFTVSDEALAETAALCKDLGTVCHVHVSEDGADNEDAVRRGYRSPLDRLTKTGALPKGSIVAHGVHFDDEDVALANARSLWVVQNPRSNRGNEVGYPIRLRNVRQVAVGTDGYPARREEERRALLEEANRHGDSPAAVMRLEGGHALIRSWFNVERDRVVRVDGAVEDVDVAGRAVVRNGSLIAASISTLRADAKRAAAALWDRMRSLS